MHASPPTTPVPGRRTASDLRDRVPAHALMVEAVRHAKDDPDGRIPTGERTRDDGVHGERLVGAILAHVGPEWLVLHSVPVGAGEADIDHVLVGPPGVVAITTLHRPGRSVRVCGRTSMVGGRRVPHLRTAVHEAKRAARLLTTAVGFPVEAIGVVAVVGAGRIAFASPPDGGDIALHVVTDAELLATLPTGRRYSDAQLDRIVAAAVLPGTWQRQPSSLVTREDGALLAAEFDALHCAARRREVAERSRRVGRGLLAAMAGVAATVAGAWVVQSLLAG
ncbi:nuclease-related domain-containing protein [Agromyces sp. MMS24-JH15]|uniref:nuclease-related domain-containing protein n=1 Tax=Agromyces sp. MMS24-JH15 TaxID=3243765 RepID=UPI0037486FD5